MSTGSRVAVQTHRCYPARALAFRYQWSAHAHHSRYACPHALVHVCMHAQCADTAYLGLRTIMAALLVSSGLFLTQLQRVYARVYRRVACVAGLHAFSLHARRGEALLSRPSEQREWCSLTFAFTLAGSVRGGQSANGVVGAALSTTPRICASDKVSGLNARNTMSA